MRRVSSTDLENSSPDKGRTGWVYIPYYSKLTIYARQNRKNPTFAEKKVWSILRKKQLGNFKFIRQKPLETFIVDFYCSQLLLAIEIDGDSHADQEEYDQVRSDILKEKYGIIVIRYTNIDVRHNIDSIFEHLQKILKQREQVLIEKTLPSPPFSGRE